MRQEELFSEGEIVEVVRRAAELQEAGSSQGYVPGLTRDEIFRMATEAGIEPAYIEAALAERQGKGHATGSARPANEIERVLPVEVAPEEYDLVTESVKLVPRTVSQYGPRTVSQYGAAGGVEAIGRTIRGSVHSIWDHPQFAITSRGGRTRLRVWTEKATAAAVASMWAIPGVLSPLIAREQAPVVGILVALASILGAWVTFQWAKEKAQRAAVQAAEALEAGILRAAAETEARLARERGEPPGRG